MKNSRKSNELYHYGVLGMKWGVHRARKYARDTNRYVRDRQDKKTIAKYQEGNMTTNEYIRAIKRHDSEMKRKNREVSRLTAELTPKKGAKISSIYKEYKDKAISTIPHYRLKQGAKVAKNILVNVGESAVFSLLGPGGIAGLATATFAKSAAKSLAVEAVLTPVVGMLADDIETKQHKKLKGGTK